MKLLELEDTSVVDMTTQGEEGKTQLQAMLGSLDTVNTPQEVGTTIDTADGCKMKVEDWLRKCQELFPDVNTVHTSVKVQETIREALEITTTETGATADPVHLGDSASSIMDKVQEITLEIPQKQLTALSPTGLLIDGTAEAITAKTVLNFKIYMEKIMKANWEGEGNLQQADFLFSLRPLGLVALR
ncbi:uncharacterized protein [Procambarus clarkii]|uniref:uncharacterized protein isoform X1 n=1 Tax=Procambarus clarkii TaxID=6728 RepID=UPI003743EFA6